MRRKMIPLSLSCLLAFLLSLACATERRLDESAACLPARVRETRKRVFSCFLFFHAIFPLFYFSKNLFFFSRQPVPRIGTSLPCSSRCCCCCGGPLAGLLLFDGFAVRGGVVLGLARLGLEGEKKVFCCLLRSRSR